MGLKGHCIKHPLMERYDFINKPLVSVRHLINVVKRNFYNSLFLTLTAIPFSSSLQYVSGLSQWQQVLLHLLLQNAFLCLYHPLLSAVSHDPEFSLTTHLEHLLPLLFLNMFSWCRLKSSSFTLLTLFHTDLIPLPSFTDSQISSPLTSLLLFSFSSGSFSANTVSHLSSHALFSLTVNTNHAQNPIPERSELQAFKKEFRRYET